jgi:hypothetical protein
MIIAIPTKAAREDVEMKMGWRTKANTICPSDQVGEGRSKLQGTRSGVPDGTPGSSPI